MNLVQWNAAEVFIAFSEAIKPGLASDVSRYRVDGRSLPAGSSASCRMRTCALVVVRLPTAPSRAPESVTVIGLQDLASNPFAPGTETQPVSLGAGQR